MKAAKYLREDMLNHTGFKFSGQFEPTSQKDSVPTSLKALISHCLYGPNIKEQVKDESQIALSIAELLYFNSKKKDQKEVLTSF